MRSFLVSVTALLALAFTSEHALAVAIALGRGFSKAQIDGICTREGGRSYTDGENYGCVKQGCDKNQPYSSPNNYCSVQCIGDKCAGVTPARIFPPGQRYRGDLGLILNNGAKTANAPEPTTPGVPAAGTPDGGPGFSSRGPSDAGMAVGGGSVTGPGTAAGPLG